MGLWIMWHFLAAFTQVLRYVGGWRQSCPVISSLFWEERVNRKAALHSWSVSEKGIFPVHSVRNMNAPKAGDVKGRWIRQLDNSFLHWTVQTWETKDLFRDAGLADDDAPPAPWTVASMADAEAGICARVVRETSKTSICRSLGWRVVVNWSLWDSCAGRNLEREALPRRSWGGCPGKPL